MGAFISSLVDRWAAILLESPRFINVSISSVSGALDAFTGSDSSSGSSNLFFEDGLNVKREDMTCGFPPG